MFETWNNNLRRSARSHGAGAAAFLYIVVKCIRSGAPAAAEALGRRRLAGMDAPADAGTLPQLSRPRRVLH